MASSRLPVPGLAASSQEVLAGLGCDPATGLAEEEARRRLATHGPNELPRERPPGAALILARQFKDVLVAVLLVAIGLSAVLGHAVEAMAIAAILAFTVLLGFFQEHRATRAIEALRRLSAPRATVVRGGALASLATEEVVPGDLLVLAQGDVVAADARLLEGADLQVAEAALTGESLPVAKAPGAAMRADEQVADRLGMVHAGTVVASGRARAVVTATGADTELGRIGHLLATVRAERTPLQRRLASLARTLLWCGAAAVAVVVALGLARGEPPGEMVLFGLAVAVAVVPEALPAVVTISLAIGARRMARRNALVRRLPTVETLGSTTVVCSDKTGTLTLGQMAVAAIEVPGLSRAVESRGYDPEGRLDDEALPRLQELARACALCNDARLQQEGGIWSVQGDPTEGALLVLARKAGIDPVQANARWPRVGERPFSSERKRMASLHRIEGTLTAYAKGAPEAILPSCTSQLGPHGPESLDGRGRQAWRQAADALAGRGLRVLALARGNPSSPEEAEEDLCFLGLVGIRDAPRPEAKAAIAACRQAGIRPILITGDHPRTAAAVATELGILREGQVATGEDLESWSDPELARQARSVEAYARVSPAHKLRIVTALQQQGHVVAMTGDGVNDAPALRKADIGIAMGITGTDVAKQAAGMTLADDDFATIVAAVEEGRAIFDNIRKYLLFLLSTNLGEILLIALTMALGLPLPLTAVQILYVNLASDGLPALALAVDPHEEDLLRRPPRRPGQAILGRPSVLLMAVAAVLFAAANLGVFLWALSAGKPPAQAMSVVFVSLVLIQLVKAYVFRAENRPAWVRPFGNRWLNLAVLWEVGLLLALLHVPFLQQVFGTRALPLADWGVILASTVAVALALEAAKWVIRSRASGGRESATNR